MSLLMFFLNADEVVVLTDTLATTPLGEPHLFVSKCSVVPHLEMVVAHTGVAQVGHRWSNQLQTALLARDIDMLDQHVPGALRSISDEVAAEFGVGRMTSTVYHLGYSELRRSYVGYVYRSDNEYASEAMEPGFRIKPKPRGQFAVPSDITEMVLLGRQIRTEQDALPIAERIHVGGELVTTVLAKREMHVTKVCRFEDFNEQWLAMNKALRPGS